MKTTLLIILLLSIATFINSCKKNSDNEFDPCSTVTDDHYYSHWDDVPGNWNPYTNKVGDTLVFQSSTNNNMVVLSMDTTNEVFMGCFNNPTQCPYHCYFHRTEYTARIDDPVTHTNLKFVIQNGWLDGNDSVFNKDYLHIILQNPSVVLAALTFSVPHSDYERRNHFNGDYPQTYFADSLRIKDNYYSDIYYSINSDTQDTGIAYNQITGIIAYKNSNIWYVLQ